MGSNLLSEIGERLVEAYYFGDFIRETEHIKNYVKHLGQDFDEFLFLNALLKYAKKPGTDEYNYVLPVLKSLVNYFPVIKRGWRKTFESFLVNRILKKGNVPEFHVDSLEEYFILRDDLIGILNKIPNEKRIFAWVIYKSNLLGQPIPVWVLDYSGFSEFQVEFLKEHRPGEILEDAYFSSEQKKQLREIGFRFTSDFIKPEDYIEILDFEW